jgi:SOS response regulatory protein OraA/RecX
VLEHAGLLDDGRFASGRARSLAGRGYGDAAIRADLERRGVEHALAADAVAALEPEHERAARLVERRGPSRTSAAWLARRGFGEDAVESALGHLVAGEP